jgi:outer membrane protein TolC
MKQIFALWLSLMTFTGSGAQDNLKPGELSLNDFFTIINKFHPQAKQIRLLAESAEAGQLAAKGQLDPKLFYDFNNKYFDGKNYYALSDGGIKLSTRYAVELKAGVENNGGINLNPESSTSSGGLMYTQISIPLLQGLVTDERRTILKQASLMVQFSEVEIRNAMNDLYFKAGKAYVEWQLSYQNLQIFKDAVQTAAERFIAVKKSALYGDRPYIDTVEANIQYQDRLVNLNQAELDFRNKTLYLNTFIWDNDLRPMDVAPEIAPEPVQVSVMDYSTTKFKEDFTDKQIVNHPLLQAYRIKLNQLDTERKLKVEKLKPQLNLNYNPLFDLNKSTGAFLNNYKWGFQFGFPLLLRKERGELKMTKIKMNQTRLDLLNKNNELVNKLKITENEYDGFRIQMDIIQQNWKNYEALWLAEKKLFDKGESSLFMINTRENNLINAGLKRNEIISKFVKSALEIRYTRGILYTP